MKYEELQGNKKYDNLLYAILYNRGIKNVEEYTNLNSDCVYDYKLLKNIDKAVKCLNKHIEKNSNIAILVDCDVDGYTSGAIIYKYLKENTQCQLRYILHEEKQHGLSKDVIIPKGTNLLIIPDAATNDTEQCKEISEKGIDIIILDHHEKENENPYAIVVNNQICDYPNKNLCGAAITWKFIQALDDENWTAFSYDCVDLVALALISDNMDLREYENKYIVDKGLDQIKNKLFRSLIISQEYSIHGEVTISNVQFYITPLLNALIRVGREEEKQLLFKALIEENEVFEYKKRDVGIVNENIYERVSRFCKNAHSRQKTLRDKTVSIVCEDIISKKIHNNPIIVENITDLCDRKISGLVAIQVANYFMKPTLLLRKCGDGTYSGSCRNIDNGYIENLKGFLYDTNLFEEVVGHPSAFGATIKKENIKEFNKLIQNDFKDIVGNEKKYFVDFVMSAEDIDINFMNEIDKLKCWWGNCIRSPYIVIENVCVEKKDFLVMGKERNSWKFPIKDGIYAVKFKCKNDSILKWLNDESVSSEENICISIVGQINKNFFNNVITMQIIVEDYNIESE